MTKFRRYTLVVMRFMNMLTELFHNVGNVVPLKCEHGTCWLNLLILSLIWTVFSKKQVSVFWDSNYTFSLSDQYILVFNYLLLIIFNLNTK